MNRPLTASNHLVQASLMTLVMLLCAARAHGAPQGELDATFGDNGRLILQFGDSHAGHFAFGKAATQQPADGKLLFAGYYYDNDEDLDFAVLRLHSDGTADGTFGVNGIARVDFGSTADAASAARLVVQPDGRIIVVGYAYQVNWESSDFALVRLNPDGTLDATFGDNGRVTLDVGGDSEGISDISLLPNGQFVVLGTSDANVYWDAVFARFEANGTLDTSFGTGPVAGTTIFGVSDRQHELRSMIRQPDGKLVACGITVHIDNGVDYSSDMLAIRVNANGSVDSSFGSNGIAQVNDPAQHSDAHTCALMPGGTLMLAGSRGGPGIHDPALVRLLPDGRQDTTFGSAGISGFKLDLSAGVQAIALLDDGSLGVTGISVPLHTSIPTDLFVARVDPETGVLDSSFGNNGVTIVDFGQSSDSGLVQASGLITQADGKLIAVGQERWTHLALARVDPAGSGSRGFAGLLETSADVSEASGSLVVTVRRTGGSVGSLAVDYTTVASTAAAPSDFTAVSGTLTWQTGDMDPKTIVVPITNDVVTEGSEYFQVVLSNSTGGLAAKEFNAHIVGSAVGPPPPAPRNGGNGGGGATGIETLVILALLWALRREWCRDPRGRSLTR